MTPSNLLTGCGDHGEPERPSTSHNNHMVELDVPTVHSVNTTCKWLQEGSMMPRDVLGHLGCLNMIN